MFECSLQSWSTLKSISTLRGRRAGLVLLLNVNVCAQFDWMADFQKEIEFLRLFLFTR